MSEALGWGMTGRPYPTVATGTAGGGTDPACLGGSGARRTVAGERAEGRWVPGGDWSEGQAGAAPEDWEAAKRMGAGMVERYGERPGRALDEPAFTIRANAGGMEPGGFVWRMRSNYGTSGDPKNRGMRSQSEPAQTIISKVDRQFWVSSQTTTTIRVTLEEAAILQSYPPGFIFCGGKGRQFEQVGNAVPPLLAEAVLREVLS